MVSLPAGGWRVFDQLKLRGGKANWAYTLNEPSQGRIAVRLQLGSATA